MQTNAKKLFDRISTRWRVSSLFFCILKLVTTYIVFKLKTKQRWLFKVWGICFGLWFQFIGEETVCPWRICSSLLWWKWSSSPRTLFLHHLYLHGHPRQKKTSLTFVFFHVNLGWWEHWNPCVLTGCFCLLKSDLSDIFLPQKLKKTLVYTLVHHKYNIYLSLAVQICRQLSPVVSVGVAELLVVRPWACQADTVSVSLWLTCCFSVFRFKSLLRSTCYVTRSVCTTW